MTNSLKPLVMMQLKDKLDFSFTKSKRQLIAKIILPILAIVAVTAVIYILFYLSKLMNIFSLVNMVPMSVVVVVFTVMQILSIITCTYSLMKNLYFAKDNQFLLTLPVTTNKLFLSKLIVFYIYEVIKNLFFTLPLFLAYGLISGASVAFFFWLPVCIAIISLIPVSIGAFLSIFAMGIAIFLKSFSVIKWILFAIVVGGCITGVVFLINAIPANIDIMGSWGTLFWDIQDFLNAFTANFYPFTKIVQMVLGTFSGAVLIPFTLTTLYVLLSILAFVVVLIALSFLISKPLFFKMASTPFEFKRTLQSTEKQNKKVKSFYSSVNKEKRVIFRTPDEVYSLVGIAIALPILILLLNKVFASMNTRLLGDYMSVSFNLLIIALIAMASNNTIASVFSREGAAGYLIKIRPNNYHQNLIAKFIIQAVVMTISIIVSICIFSFFNKLSVGNVICFGLTSIFLYLSHLLWSAEMDVMNPQYDQYATTGTHISNPNETKSTIAMLFLSFVFFGISLFLSVENIATAWIKVGIVALAILGYRIWSFYNKVKYYYKEK